MSVPAPAAGLEPGVLRPAGTALRVVLHVGTFKTGTSYVQNVLWGGREVLAAQGVLFPGRANWEEQVHAVRDRLGMRVVRPRQHGAWNRLVEQLAGWAGTHAVISMEFLSLAGATRARRIVADLAPAEVLVVLTARDLARVVPASWQERVKNGRAWTWTEFVAGIQQPNQDCQPGKGFWSQQDLAAIARRWAEAVGDDAVTVVTVPPSGADAAELLGRLGEASDLDLSGPDPNPTWDNASLGAVETEALRRINVAVGDQSSDSAWSLLVKRGLAREGIDMPSRPLLLTADDMAWLQPMQRRVVDELAGGGWRVVGDLADLMPTSPRVATRAVDDVDEADVSTALALVAAELGRRLLAEQARTSARRKGSA